VWANEHALLRLKRCVPGWAVKVTVPLAKKMEGVDVMPHGVLKCVVGG
jgi:hypothetical protein